MFNLLHRKPLTQGLAVKPDPSQIDAIRAAQLLGLHEPEFQKAVTAGHLPKAVNPEQPMGSWRWDAQAILALAVQSPRGFQVPAVSSRTPAPRRPVTVSFRQAAKMLGVTPVQFSEFVDRAPPGGDVPRRLWGEGGKLVDVVFFCRLHAFAKAHHPRAVFRIEQWMHTRHLAYDQDGQIYWPQ